MEHEVQGETVIMRFRGKLDYADYSEIEQILAKEAAKVDRGGLVVNLTGLDAITSSGISILAKLSMDHRLKVVKPRDLVKDLLDLSGVSRILDIVDEEDQAVRGLSSKD